jgi:hypothetical protein
MPLNATREFIAGILASQLILLQLLDKKGLLSKAEYQEALKEWLRAQPQDKYTTDHNLPLNYLIRKLSD